MKKDINNKIEKRNNILNESKKLFLENGVQETYISTILKKCGISNGTLFYYFDSKDKIVLEIYQEIKDQSEDFFYNSEMDMLSFEMFLAEYWKKNICWILENNKEYNFIKTFSNYPIIKEKYIKNKSTEEFIKRIEDAIGKKETSITDSDLFFKTFIAFRDALIVYVFDNLETMDKNEIEKLAADYLKRFIIFIK